MQKALTVVMGLGLSAYAANGVIPGWFVSGGGRADYVATKDTSVKKSGTSSARFTTQGKTDKYGTLMQAFNPQRYAGKRVRLSAWVKTQGATGRVDLWSRVQAANSPGDGPGIAGSLTRLPETSDWKRYEHVFDVSADGVSLQYGVGLQGPGTLWLDNVKLEVVDKNTPLSDGSPTEPVNLDFED
ncbi:MAG: hypothetical protein K1X64_19915 [Myxococcaceae bacterium]|nr:hypothetical protein [Myxococcaceae bacterium]